jgi:hypothetical protein
MEIPTGYSDNSKQAEIDQDKDLYYAFKKAVETGTASHVVANLDESDESGHIAWNKLKEWFQSPVVKDDLIDLDESLTAGEYINDWVICQKKLTELESGYEELEYKRRPRF